MDGRDLLDQRGRRETKATTGSLARKDQEEKWEWTALWGPPEFMVFQDHLVSLALQDSLAAMELMVVMEKWVLRAPRDPRDRLGHRDSKAPKENLVREA